MELSDVFSGAGAVVAVLALLASIRANRISARALRIAQDTAVIDWICQLDTEGFPDRLINKSMSRAHGVQVAIAVDGLMQPALALTNTVAAYASVETNLRGVKERYISDVWEFPLAYSDDLTGPRLAAASIALHIVVDSYTAAGSPKRQEFRLDVSHAVNEGRVVYQLRSLTGSFIKPETPYRAELAP